MKDGFPFKFKPQIPGLQTATNYTVHVREARRSDKNFKTAKTKLKSTGGLATAVLHVEVTQQTEHLLCFIAKQDFTEN